MQPSALRSLWSRLQVPLVILAATHVISVLGFKLLWADVGGTWLDALFQTFSIVSTIGLGAEHPLGDAGRLLTMVIGASGIGSVFYSFTVLLDYATSEPVRLARRTRRMQRTIDALSAHTIVAGIGRVGREAAAELVEANAPFVVVDPSSEARAICEARGWPYLVGDASDDAVLLKAGVKRAKGLIVTTANDATNLYVVLSARLLNPQLFIATRAVDEASVTKLERAGANRAISPYAIGGRRLAHLTVSPRTVEFFETQLRRGAQGLNLDQLVVSSSSKAVGQQLDALSVAATGASILAVVRASTTIAPVPADFVLRADDSVLAIGNEAQLLALSVSLS